MIFFFCLNYLAKEVIKNKGLEKITVEDLVQEITPRGRATVPSAANTDRRFQQWLLQQDMASPPMTNQPTLHRRTALHRHMLQSKPLSASVPDPLFAVAVAMRAVAAVLLCAILSARSRRVLTLVLYSSCEINHPHTHPHTDAMEGIELWKLHQDAMEYNPEGVVAFGRHYMYN